MHPFDEYSGPVLLYFMHICIILYFWTGFVEPIVFNLFVFLPNLFVYNPIFYTLPWQCYFLSHFHHVENFICLPLIVFCGDQIVDVNKTSLNATHFLFLFSFCPMYPLLTVSIYKTYVVTLVVYLSYEGIRSSSRHMGMSFSRNLHSLISYW